MEEEKKSLEGQMENLKQIVEALENQDMPLEEAMALYEQGNELCSAIGKMLDECQTKVEYLTKES